MSIAKRMTNLVEAFHDEDEDYLLKCLNATIGEMAGILSAAGKTVTDDLSLEDYVKELENMDVPQELEEGKIRDGFKMVFGKIVKLVKKLGSHKKTYVGHSPKKFHAKPSSYLWKPGRSRQLARA